MIRTGRREAHRRFMLGGCRQLEPVPRLLPRLPLPRGLGAPSRARVPLRRVYFTILITHTILAVAIVPLVLVTLSRARAGDFAAHRRLARVTLPLWAYVSVTGVVIYWMLYRL